MNTFCFIQKWFKRGNNTNAHQLSNGRIHCVLSTHSSLLADAGYEPWQCPAERKEEARQTQRRKHNSTGNPDTRNDLTIVRESRLVISKGQNVQQRLAVQGEGPFSGIGTSDLVTVTELAGLYILQSSSNCSLQLENLMNADYSSTKKTK